MGKANLSDLDIPEAEKDDDGSVSKSQMYTNVAYREKEWVEQKANMMGGSNSEAIRMIIRQAMLYEETKEDVEFI